MKPSFLILALLILSGYRLSAQHGKIEGLIADAESNAPVNGATVHIGNHRGYLTDHFGRFLFPMVDGGQYELLVSHIGYKTTVVPVEVKAGISSMVSIRLKKAELDLAEVRINSKKTSALQTLGALDIKLRPVNNAQDLLRIVPGLFIAQHAGGGKAEQIFLRGFDIDHGTDIAITIDGIPVNMPSHAHGQGYADLHFLIPETVEKIAFDKGPYQASKGNMATAAYVDFNTREFLEENMLKAEAGRFNTKRLTGMVKLMNKSSEEKREQVYLASEFNRTDGYFESPQNFHRFNLMGKYNSCWGKQTQLTISASTFDSKWFASGQIPDRAVRSGQIGRFGAIDDTEGGHTIRTNISARFNKQWKSNWKTTDHLYFSRYQFNLYSNFTFFLDDPVNGDMIRQKEKRNIWGYTTTASRSSRIGSMEVATTFGSGFRHDDIKGIELSKESRTRFYKHIQKGDIRETNVFAWVNQDLELGQRFSLNASLRYDQFHFRYRNELNGDHGFAKQTKGILSPRMNLSFTAGPKTRIYLSNGIGFHSNDTRVILSKDANNILPRVIGTDLGIVLKPAKPLLVKTVIWHLYSEQEFIYVGDAGIVEPGGKSRRLGIDLSVRYQFNPWLFADMDLNLTHARAIEEAKGEDYIPLAPALTSIGGLTAKTKNGFSASLRYRLIGERPANEDHSIKAAGYFLLDALLNYRIKKFDFMLSGENLLNRNWREAQFNTESRLSFEAAPVTEIHYTPGTPIFIRGGISFYF